MCVSEDGNYIAYTLLVQKHIDEGVGYSNIELYLYDVKKQNQDL